MFPDWFNHFYLESFLKMSKKYTREALVNAVFNNLDSKAAAIEFNVPASTIRHHRRKPPVNIRIGRPSYITSDQEKHFVFSVETSSRLWFRCD